MLATMMETPEKAAPMTPVTGCWPAAAVAAAADALPWALEDAPDEVDEVGEEHGCNLEGREFF